MDGKILARIGAVVFVAIAVTATAIEMTRKDERQNSPTAQTRTVRERDPLGAELARCSAMGEAGPRDPSCLRAWAENRKRFLGQSAPAPAPAEPATLFPNAPADAARGNATPAIPAEPSQPEAR
ncbi:MAG: putative entry exclusion protein TrbK-alt [Hyphomonadaceae bacterium]|jgi:conjugative transfer region protein TrbK|uniref:putative entry exclusion protein TrbK-alt n=1 Tax=Rhizorhabdus sp. TaxID=1968843 RepID=UPI001B640807|nr:putative entry exclusion protein TrbK-alt [Rhizorhabdus sp.]MBP8234746.1 putative entry exclusion protein TrbK-alt [Rhizorhabdus sp.]MBP9233030.1 putative entry exclusion protein TrbK-alt [Hyphomonadaceae bacterium]